MPDQERDEPSLELKVPRLRLRRRRTSEPPTPPSGASSTVPEPATVEEPPPPPPEPAQPIQPAQPAASGGRPTIVSTTSVEEPPPPAPEPIQPDQPARRRAPTELPLPTGWVAVVLTGLVVGLAVVGLTWASLRTCEAVQGTATCGTAGYPMLALVVVVAILVGSMLLRLTHVPDPVSTSILGVGVASVLALVFLIDHLDQPAMVVVIPLICAATFAGSHWLTTAVIEPGDR